MHVDNILDINCGQIGPFQSTKSERAKVKVKVRLNLHGIVSIDAATVSLGNCLNNSYCDYECVGDE